MSVRLAGCAFLAAAAAGRARAQAVVTDINEFASYSAGYNLVTLGNATFQGGSQDVQGAIAVGGNLSVTGSWGFANNNGLANDPSLYVKGTANFNGGLSQLNNGYAYLPNEASSGLTWNSTAKALYDGSTEELHMNSSASKASNDPSSSANAPTISPNFATSGANSFAGISSSLAGMSTTSGASIGVGSDGNLDFTTSATSGVVVFDLNASDLSSTVVGGVTEYGNSYYNGTSWSSFSGIQIAVPSGVDYVINVLGLASNSELFSNVNINSGSNNDQLLWNFNETSNTTISVGGNFYGSILAPNVNLTDNTTINGTVVAQSFTDNNVELHDTDDFVSVVVPESGSYALWGLALCLAVAVGGRRLRLSRARS